jgi:hypothetical protein
MKLRRSRECENWEIGKCGNVEISAAYRSNETMTMP